MTAADQTLKQYERRIYRICRYWARKENPPINPDDLTTEVRQFVKDNLHRYDPDRGTMTTFIDMLAGGKVRHLIRDHHRVNPGWLQEFWSAAKLEEKLGRKATVLEMANEFGLTEEQVLSRYSLDRRTHSLSDLEWVDSDKLQCLVTEDTKWEGALAAARHEKLVWAISKLPNRQREAMERRFLKDQDVAQIMQEMGYSSCQGVYALIHLATKRLRILLSDCKDLFIDGDDNGESEDQTEDSGV